MPFEGGVVSVGTPVDKLLIHRSDMGVLGGPEPCAGHTYHLRGGAYFAVDVGVGGLDD